MVITLEQLQKVFPRARPERLEQCLPHLAASLAEFQITSRLRQAAYLAQVGHESCDLKYMQEIASGQAYEGRADLGNTQPGDGRRFKGRGPIQTTGRANYARAGQALTLPLTEQPGLLTLPKHGFRASAFFWKSNKLNELADGLTGLCDAGDMKRFDKISRRVNGGTNGRMERQARYRVAVKALSPAPVTQPSLKDEIETIPIERVHAVSAGKRIALKLARPFAILWAALEAGNVWAIAGVVVVIIGAVYLGYVHRARIHQASLWIIRKVKALK